MSDDYISFIKNPLVAGLIVGGLTFAWFKYNEMKIPVEEKEGKERDNKIYIIPLIVAFVTGILVYLLFKDDSPSSGKNNIDINAEIAKENILSTGSTMFIKNGIQIPDRLPQLPDALINVAK